MSFYVIFLLYMQTVYEQETRRLTILVCSEQSSVKPYPLTFIKNMIMTVHNSDRLGLLATVGGILKLRNGFLQEMMTVTQTLNLQSKTQQVIWKKLTGRAIPIS